MNNSFASRERVKMDLFLRFGAIAAAGDRHLAEFCPGSWYLKDPETVKSWCFGLTTVAWRKEDLKKRLERSERLYTGEETPVISQTGEEGVQQMRAILGLRDLVTNVNIPNLGQIPNLPFGAVVETNAHFFCGQRPPRICRPASGIHLSARFPRQRHTGADRAGRPGPGSGKSLPRFPDGSQHEPLHARRQTAV